MTLARIIKNFKRKYPLINFNLYIASGEHVKELLDKGLVDIGIFLEPINKEKYEFVYMPIKERWVIVMRVDVRSEIANYFGDNFANLKIAFTSNLSTNSSIMVKHGLGYSLVIEGSMPFINNIDICYRPLYPELTTSSFIAWKRY